MSTQTILLWWLHKRTLKMNKDSGIICTLEGYLFSVSASKFKYLHISPISGKFKSLFHMGNWILDRPISADS